MGLHVFYENPQLDENDDNSHFDPMVDHHLWLKSKEFDQSSDIEMIIKDIISQFSSRIAGTENGESGLIYKYYQTLTFSFSVYKLNFGRGCLAESLKLPTLIRSRNALYTLRVGQDDCFCTALNHYFHVNNLDITPLNAQSIQPTMTFRDIAKLERENPFLRIHVLCCEMTKTDDVDHFTIAYQSKNKFRDGIFDVPLFIHNKHYFLVKDLGKVLKKTNKKGNVRRLFFCFVSRVSIVNPVYSNMKKCAATNIK